MRRCYTSAASRYADPAPHRQCPANCKTISLQTGKDMP